jgi:hypothetical protein
MQFVSRLFETISSATPLPEEFFEPFVAHR